MSEFVFSCIIPCSAKDAESQNLKDLIASIKAQDFPQDKIEILVITEGDSEQAKAIGIRKAKGEICAMFCADNYIVSKNCFRFVNDVFRVNKLMTGLYFKRFAYNTIDNSLNRYFSLIGNNDPICFYLQKNDRKPYYNDNNYYDEFFTYFVFKDKVPSLGCNGFFYWTDSIKRADLDHYYPMDCAEDLRRLGESRYYRVNAAEIWHRTSDNLITFLIKRYKYARDLYSDRNDRRWKMLDTREDYWRLLGFIIASLTLIEPLFISLRLFKRTRDWAAFWHWPVCFGFLITYGILTLRNICTVLLSSRRLADLSRLGTVLSPCGIRQTKTSR